MKVLAIDTSNQAMSIAVLEDSKVISEWTTNIKRNHSEQVMPAIASLIKEAGWQPKQLDKIVVAKGPGSYTGLRIGVTTAKTLAWTLGKELVGVSSLEVLAANCTGKEQYIIPLFDARRGTIYTSLYRSDAKGNIKQIEPDTHILAEDWALHLSKIEGEFCLVGEDSESYYPLFSQYLHKRIHESPLQDRLPRAGVLGILGMNKIPENIHTFIPSYMKLAEAEENWRKKHPDKLGDTTYVEKI